MWGAVALAAGGFAPAAAVDGEYEAAVTRVPCKLTQRLSSQDANAGERFSFDTTSSAEIGGVFLPAGTHGHGFVRVAYAARGPRPGALELEARSLDLPGGEEIEVGLEPGQLDRRLSRFRGAQSAGVGNVIVGGPQPTNVVYEAGTAFVVTAPPPATPAPDAPATTPRAG